MLTGFATWWLQQMLGLLPRRAQAWQSRGRDTLLIEPSIAAGGGGWSSVTLLRRIRHRDRPLGRFALDEAGIDGMRAALRSSRRPQRVVLRLAAPSLLEQIVTLPSAAERSIGAVLLHDMDRTTPFRAEAVFWTWAIERHDRARGRLHVRLTLMPRAALDPVIRRLGLAGILPTEIEAPAPDGNLRILPAAADGPERLHRQRRAIKAAAGVCATLAIAAVMLPFAHQALAIWRIEHRIAAVQPSVAEAEALRRRIAGEASGANAVALERARAGDAVAALAAITAILPDNTFLSAFGLTQRRISMTGESQEAALLIPALSADPSIRNPSFAAPVTRTGKNGADLFSIRAELAP